MSKQSALESRPREDAVGDVSSSRRTALGRTRCEDMVKGRKESGRTGRFAVHRVTSMMREQRLAGIVGGAPLHMHVHTAQDTERTAMRASVARASEEGSAI